MINAHTQVCAVIGKPVRHSLSPNLHNAAFRELGLDYVYVAFQVSDVGAAIDGVRGLGIRGLSVTIPHKVEVMKHLDEIDPLAVQTGSVNTVVNRDGHLYGTSSDGLGALKALDEAGVDPSGKRVLILGAGGAARAVGFALASKAGIREVRILALEEESDRTSLLAADLAKVAGIPTGSGTIEDERDLRHSVGQADLLVNCTPVGMSPNADATPVPAEYLHPGLAVFDVVYTPRKTRLLREALLIGCKTVDGLGMFVHQAAVQFELWTEAEAPIDLMRRVVTEALGSRAS